MVNWRRLLRWVQYARHERRGQSRWPESGRSTTLVGRESPPKLGRFTDALAVRGKRSHSSGVRADAIPMK
jgi:hypothetical protein